MLKQATPILPSLNNEETISFYLEKLGFTLVKNWGNYLLFSKDGVGLHFWDCDNPVIAQNSACYFYVTEIDKLYAEYEPKGVIHPNGPLAVKPWGMKQFSVLDNNGNLINFGEYLDQR